MCAEQLNKVFGSVALIALIFAAPPCNAGPFDDRLALAEKILAARQNKTRSKWIYEHIAVHVRPILEHCFLTVENGDNSGFILIGDVMPSGKVVSIEVWPSTNISRCVAAGLQTKVFEAPPLNTRMRSFPLVMDSVHVL